jgi:hypothetical protein
MLEDRWDRTVPASSDRDMERCDEVRLGARILLAAGFVTSL